MCASSLSVVMWVVLVGAKLGMWASALSGMMWVMFVGGLN
jgi:hypothetical protein